MEDDKKIKQKKDVTALIAEFHYDCYLQADRIFKTIKSRDIRSVLIKLNKKKQKSVNDIYSAFLANKIDYETCKFAIKLITK